MADKAASAGGQNASKVSTQPSAGSASNGPTSTAPPKRPAPEGNPAFRMMGLPRFRLPSRNWLIFLSITGSITAGIMYDKYQTRRAREKWCSLVSHLADETLDSHMLPRRMTIYLAAPPGDGLRSAREHFHTYVKPVLVAAAMDWDVVEGRKEGDVRFKTAERARRKRKKREEGEPLSDEEAEKLLLMDGVRANNGTREHDGVAGDLVIGRHTWKEYIRGLHEGWLGPVDPPKEPDAEKPIEDAFGQPSTAGHSSLGDAAVKAAVNNVLPAQLVPGSTEPQEQDALPTADETAKKDAAEEEKKKKEEEEKPKPRQPPPYISPSEYNSATASPNMPELIGPSIGVQLPHILGFRNTPIRIYRFFTRRRLADSIGRDVAAAVLASYRSYDTALMVEGNNKDRSDTAEQKKVLEQEERDWWKTTFQPRKEHEEAVWIEDIVLDERIASRMRTFQLTAEDEDRAKRIGDGTEKVVKKSDLADD